MARWAVGHYSLFDNVLSVRIVQAGNWKEAAKQHPEFQDFDFSSIESLEDAKEEAFNSDQGLDVVEIVDP